MACDSIVALPLACSDGSMGGVEKLYIVAYKDAKAINTGTTEVYSAATNGVVNTISLNTGKKFVEVGLLKSTTGLKETLTKDNTKGTCFYTQSLSLVLGDISVENQTFIKSVQNQPVIAIVKSRNGKYVVAGLNGQFELKTLEGGTGTAEADQVGYTMGFEGLNKSTSPLVDSSIITGLI